MPLNQSDININIDSGDAKINIDSGDAVSIEWILFLSDHFETIIFIIILIIFLSIAIIKDWFTTCNGWLTTILSRFGRNHRPPILPSGTSATDKDS